MNGGNVVSRPIVTSSELNSSDAWENVMNDLLTLGMPIPSSVGKSPTEYFSDLWG